MDDMGPIETIEEFNTIQHRLSMLEDRADRIANVLCPHRADFVRFGIDEVVYEFNDACHCHPEIHNDRFPAAYLFDPEWEGKYKAEAAEKARLKAEEEDRKKADAETRKLAASEGQDRADYERLREKFEGPVSE